MELAIIMSLCVMIYMLVSYEMNKMLFAIEYHWDIGNSFDK